MPAGGRCRYRYGGNEFGGCAHRKCIRRNIRVCNGGFGGRLKGGTRGTGYGDHTFRRYRGDGALQQLYLRSERLGRSVPGVCGELRNQCRYERAFGKLYNKALEGDKDCGGLLAYNYFSGEPVSGANEGRPLFVRKPDAHFNLANFMRTHLYAALATLKIGLDILLKEEKVKGDRIYGHGGLLF